MHDILNIIINYAAVGFGLTFGVIGAIGYFKLMGLCLTWIMKKLKIIKHNYYEPGKSYNPYEVVRLLGHNYQVLAASDDKESIYLKSTEDKVKYKYMVLNMYRKSTVDKEAVHKKAMKETEEEPATENLTESTV